MVSRSRSCGAPPSRHLPPESRGPVRCCGGAGAGDLDRRAGRQQREGEAPGRPGTAGRAVRAPTRAAILGVFPAPSREGEPGSGVSQPYLLLGPGRDGRRRLMLCPSQFFRSRRIWAEPTRPPKSRVSTAVWKRFTRVVVPADMGQLHGEDRLELPRREARQCAPRARSTTGRSQPTTAGTAATAPRRATARPIPRRRLLRLSARRLGIGRAVALLESAAVTVPAVVGWLRPVVLVPASTLAGLSPRQLEAILAHELAHVRRHDYLVNLFQTAVETLLFFDHPAVWWVSAQMRRERESCCARPGGDRLRRPSRLRPGPGGSRGLRNTAPRLALAASGGSLADRVRRLVGARTALPAVPGRPASSPSRCCRPARRSRSPAPAPPRRRRTPGAIPARAVPGRRSAGKTGSGSPSRRARAPGVTGPRWTNIR